MSLPEPPDFRSIAAVLIGGGFGSYCRFVTGHYFPSWFGTDFPWATLFVNVTGSIWLGLVGTLAITRPGSMDQSIRLLLTTGFAGGFTTFSTFAFECLALYQRGDVALVAANIAANLLLGLLGVLVGAMVARVL